MIDQSEVERALLAKLAGDPELSSYLPDGVFWDLAVQGATRFAIVSASTSRAQMEFGGGDAWRELVYIVKAVVQSSGTPAIAQADARIAALLDRQPLELPPAAGAGLMVLHWLDRVRYTENVDGNTWQHRGARYEVIVTPVGAAAPAPTVPPTITTPPASATINAGDSVTLTVVAAGTPPLAYQWQRAGVDVAGATGASYVTGPLTSTAVYTVRVSNLYGAITSAPATVTVVPAPLTYQERVLADGATAYWPLDDALGSVTARELVSGNAGTISGGVTLRQPGIVAAQFAMTFDGATGRILTAAPVTTPPTVTVEAWVNYAAGGGGFITILSNRSAAPASGELFLGFQSARQLGVFDGSGASGVGVGVTAVDTWTHCVAVCNGTTVTFYRNAVLDGAPAFARTASGNAAVGLAFDVPGGLRLKGSLADVAIYPRALTLAEIQAHFTARTAARF